MFRPCWVIFRENSLLRCWMHLYSYVRMCLCFHRPLWGISYCPCTDCILTIQCTDCILTIQCTDCIQTIQCTDCIQTIQCTDCMLTIQCTDCMLTIQCTDCILTIQCTDCILTIQCTDSTRYLTTEDESNGTFSRNCISASSSVTDCSPWRWPSRVETCRRLLRIKIYVFWCISWWILVHTML
jgi:hypothetical protein